MAENFSLTGGARIGKANATFPFASLSVNKNRLEINASLIGNLVFQPQDVISIEPYATIPLFGQGIKIIHRVESYKPVVIFWTFKDPRFVINEIVKTGFMHVVDFGHGNNDEEITNDEEIMKKQAQGGFPIKKTFVIVFVVLWNILLLSGFIPFILEHQKSKTTFGPGVNIVLGMVFTTAVLSLISERFRKLILKEGRTRDDIKKVAYFLIVLTGFQLLCFASISAVLNK